MLAVAVSGGKCHLENKGAAGTGAVYVVAYSNKRIRMACKLNTIHSKELTRPMQRCA